MNPQAKLGVVGLLLTCSVFTEASGHGKHASWNYNLTDTDKGPSNWPGHCTSGKHQSPINIETSKATVKCGLTPLKLSSDWSKFVDDYTLKNTGHSLQVSSPSFAAKTISGGGLDQVYQLEQIHFHWAEKNSGGSEHTVGNLHFPMEMHMVAVRKGSTVTKEVKLSNDKASSAAANSLAVIGVLFAITDKESKVATELKEIVKVVEKHHGLLKNKGIAKIAAKDDLAMNIQQLLPHQKAFYRYQGSLTTPTCNEIVTWTVAAKEIFVTQRILDAFRKIRDASNEKIDNYRPHQPLNGRTVEYYSQQKCDDKPGKEDAESKENTAPLISLSICTIVLALFAFVCQNL